jgi:hypothetical protein
MEDQARQGLDRAAVLETEGAPRAHRLGVVDYLGPKSAVLAIYKHIPGWRKEKNGGILVPCNTTNFNLTISLAGTRVPIYWGDMMEGLGEGDDDTMCVSSLDWLEAGDSEDGYVLEGHESAELTS